MKRHPQSLDPAVEQAPRSQDTSLQPFELGEPIPARCDVPTMRRIFGGISASQFHRLERQGKFRRFELTPQIGSKAWSGARIAKYLTGDSFTLVVKKSA